ncbi:MAG: acyloxyacyl hydrolase [Cyclobacteriaceae bacterium]|nr:acyloxyacyl hydrolase [Cyclobacteriaceae bacterium]MCH8515735.1 acyloxyacyl hydrolase [Cyclobacteriaceae bacterium]
MIGIKNFFPTGGRILILFFFYFLWNEDTKAQSARSNHLSLGFTQANILTHSDRVKPFAEYNPRTFRINWSQSSDGSKSWHHYYKLPHTGISLFAIDYESPILGNSYGANLFIDFTLRQYNTGKLYFRSSAGFSYQTNPYDASTNPDNLLFGSPFAVALQLQLGYEWQLLPDWQLQTAVDIFHSSNGAVRLPNSGVNAIGLEAQLKYQIKDATARVVDRENAHRPQYKANNLQVQFTAAMVDDRSDEISRTGAYFLQTYMEHRLNDFHGFSYGLEGVWNLRSRDRIDQQFDIDDEDRPDYRRLAATVGYEMYFDRLSFMVRMGAYIYRPHREDQMLFQRYVLKYQIFKDAPLFAVAGLRAYTGSADAFDMGLLIKL